RAGRQVTHVQLVVGEATRSTDGVQSKTINWGGPTPLLKQIARQTQGELRKLLPTGGAGALTENGTLLFPLEGRNNNGDIVSVITYSTDDGKNWYFLKGIPPAKCFNPRITEWERGDEF
ncbi:85 kDa surface glycoprotein, partial [Trypanosoma cruzi]